MANTTVKEKKQPTIADILEKYNLKVVNEYEPVDRLPTGSLQMDRALGGGWAVGRVQEIWGPPSHGKSLLTMMTIGRTLFSGKKAILYDLEKSFDPNWARFFMEVDNENFILVQKHEDTYGEGILNSIIAAAHDPSVGFIALDSKDAIVFEAELEGGVGPKNMGLRAQSLGNFVRILQQVVEDSDVTFLYVSEVRANFGNTYQPLTTSGGHQLEHKCAIQVQMHSPQPIKVKIDSKEVEAGTTYNIYCNKNKTAKAKLKAGIDVRDFTLKDGSIVKAVDVANEVFTIGTELKLFTLSDGRPYDGAGKALYGERMLGMKSEALPLLRAEPALLWALETEIRKQLGWQV